MNSIKKNKQDHVFTQLFLSIAGAMLQYVGFQNVCVCLVCVCVSVCVCVCVCV